MAERNYAEDKALLYEALSSSLLEKYEKTVSESNIDAKYPSSFRIKMSLLIGVDIKKPTRSVESIKKAAIGIFVAAAVLTGCAMAYKIFGPYIETWWSDSLWVVNQNDDQGEKEIEEFYTITYVPNGYAYLREYDNFNMYVHVWQNSTGNLLKFIQSTTLSDFYTDAESGYSFLMSHNGMDVYCKEGGHDYNYKWQTDKYGFEIVSEMKMGETDIRQMIDSIKLK